MAPGPMWSMRGMMKLNNTPHPKWRAMSMCANAIYCYTLMYMPIILTNIWTFRFIAGHYSQVIWAETYAVGCGITQCPSGMSPIYACNYGPAGNYIGAPIYKIGKAGKSCPTGTTNNNGLCAWESFILIFGAGCSQSRIHSLLWDHFDFWKTTKYSTNIKNPSFTLNAPQFPIQTIYISSMLISE